MTTDDPRARAREAKLKELNARHGTVWRRACALRDAARARVFATGEFFDEVTAREDAITEAGGAELTTAEREAVELEQEIRRVAALPLSAFE